MTTKPCAISILFASPNQLMRDMIMQGLNRHKSFEVVACATSAQQVLDAVRSADIDVALISATLADGPLSGIGALRQISEHFPTIRTVILLDGHEHNLVVDAFRARARGVFCLSQSAFRLLQRCVEQIHAGQIWASSSELAEIVGALSQLAPMRVVNAEGMRLLTEREENVVRLVAEGLQNREIARQLKLSEHTIKNYLFRIFDKLGVSSRVELVLLAVSSTKSAQIAFTPIGKPATNRGASVKTGEKSLAVGPQAISPAAGFQ